MAPDSPRPRVVIVGGGFGGIFAAKRLRRSPVDITLVDRGTSHLFQPLLYQCATGVLSEGQITSPIRTILRGQLNARVLVGEATSVDPTAATVEATRPDGSKFQLAYDYLIVAVGMRQSYFGHDEFAPFAPGMKTLDDALEVRRRILGAFEMAETLPTAEERRQWLTFAVVGAGPTGVELAGQIRELAMRTVSQEFRRIDPAEARVLLFDGGDAVLASFGRQLSARAKKILDRLGVETHLGIVVSHVDGAGLDASTKDGAVTHYPARTVLWTAGVEAVSFVTTLAAAVGAEQDRAGRIKVKPDLTLPGCPNIWAVGDVISLDGLPGVAEVALQGGVHAGGQIHRLVTGKVRPAERFKYRDLGTAAYLCRFHAVIKVGPVRLSGFAGWLAWGFIHLAFLNGLRARAATLSTWMLTLARDRRSERAILYRASR